MSKDIAELSQDLAVALSWDGPSRWAIGAMMRELNAAGGDDAVWQAVPEGRERVAKLCQQVYDRWPEGMADADLEWGHYRRVVWLDDAAAAEALALARDGGWTPSQLGRYLAGYSPDEPGVADMARAVARSGALLLLGASDDRWLCTGAVLDEQLGAWLAGIGGGVQPSIAGAIKAAWRQRFGAAVAP